MRFGLIEANVIEVTHVAAFGESLLLVLRDPSPPQRFFLRRENKPILFLCVARPCELGGNNRADPDRGREIISIVAELHVVARIGRRWSHQSLDSLPLMTDLPRRERSGADGLVHVGHVVYGV